MPRKKLNREVPPHLKKYVVEQHYERYTFEDQAVWRFIMRQLKQFLSKNAHDCYSDGLTKTGISVEYIPKIEEMNEMLNDFGWGAIPVSGFIPPAAFMEFQSRGFLPIASDMRTIEHIFYTPAPDIVHEAAGHAPILIDPNFSAYLHEYAQVAANAIISKKDLEQYRLIRKLSDLKEAPDSTQEEIDQTEKDLIAVSESITEVSEAGILGRMNWWTAEYGLIGDTEKPKIFGAGLLSSFGEARSCLKDDVKKIPLSLDCINFGYDITEQQPQLFVTTDFENLTKVLHELADTMAFRRGGTESLKKAKDAQTVTTLELNNGLQVSGILHNFLVNDQKEAFFYKFDGPTQLSIKNSEIEGHSKDYHAHGFSSPLGFLQNQNRCLSSFSKQQLSAIGVEEGKEATLEFQSGIVVNGTVESLMFHDDKLMLVTFVNCTTTYGSETLFQPDWGKFDMAVGTSVVSVFGGAADRIAYGEIEADFVAERVPTKNFSSDQIRAHKFYEQIRKLRESDRKRSEKAEETQMLINQFNEDHKNLWLAGIELLELVYQLEMDEAIAANLIAALGKIEEGGDKNSPTKKCIQDGIALAKFQI